MRVGGQRHSPAALTPGKRPGTHCRGGCVGSRAVVDGYEKSCPQRNIFFCFCSFFVFHSYLFVLIVLHFAFLSLLTTHNTNIHAPGRDLNPQPQQAIGCRPSPYTAQPLRSAIRSPDRPARS